jgi:hypothetical protein
MHDAIGSWKVTMSTPAGPREMHLRIDTLSDNFTGRIESPMGNHDIAGSVTANTLNWQMKTAKTVPITVTFNVQFEGDTLSGSAKLGIFGKSTVTGCRLETSGHVAAASTGASDQAAEITGESVDPRYNQPYIDVNELRSDPVPHRYVHGGFAGTDARFSFYFPPKDRYRGRFFHNTYPMATSEDIGPFPIAFEVSTGNLGFTTDSGAYYVQTNLGGADRAGGMADPAIAAFRVNAAAAKYSRIVAAELYGAHRAYGYLFGGSGGSYQVIGSAENTKGVWDGFVAFVMATPNAVPSMFTVRMHALRVLKKRGKWASVMDAINPGGSGDPYAELNEEERAALSEAAFMGYPPRGWWNHATLSSGHFAQVAPLVPMLDPSYVEDFWTTPGYLGSDSRSSLEPERFQFETTVSEVIDGFPRQVRLAEVRAKDLADAHLLVLSGAVANKGVPIASVNDRTLGFAFAADQTVVNSIQVGDRVRIDNSWALAVQTYHRHQVPEPDQYGWNQFRNADGEPIYPQRGMLIGPIAAAGTAGAIPGGQINGKMLVLEALMDIDALPWQADWYRSKVKHALGSSFGDQFALWFIENAQHDNPQTPAAHAHTVRYEGALQQALRDVSAWVEKGEKPSSTRYEVVNSQVLVPAGANERHGIQPVLELKANGRERAEVAIDEPVTFTATVEVPGNAGMVVSAEWDFEGLGRYPLTAQIAIPQSQVRLSAAHSFSKPGTYFTALRAASQRQGDAQAPYGRVQNIARCRVVVT